MAKADHEMRLLDGDDMQQQVEIQRAAKLKYPEQVVLVTTRSASGAANVMAVGWVAVASGSPLMFVLGIDDAAYTHELILQTRQFVLAYPHEGMVRETLHAGRGHGRDRDKLAECGLGTAAAIKVQAPLLADAVANFECELVDVYKPGDCPLIVGRVLAAHINTDQTLHRLYTLAPGHQLGGVRPV
jgi:flavin reductase (DIM6/NTAB) family NADH-FMN oxidoreductase RutF